jgi:hypothetical protein
MQRENLRLGAGVVLSRATPVPMRTRVTVRHLMLQELTKSGAFAGLRSQRSAERGEGVLLGRARIARSQHQQVSLGIAPQEDETEFGCAFGMPTGVSKAFDCFREGGVQIHPGVDAFAFECPPFKIPDDQVTRCR